MAFITAETRSDIIALVVTMLNRAPDSALLDELVTASTSGKSLAEVADMIAATAEFTAENSASQTAKEYATAALDRAFQGATVTADLRTAAVDLAVTYLNDGMTKAGLASVINDFLALPSTLENADFGNIAAAFANKNTVAEYYVLEADLGDQTAAELAAAIASVTEDAASVTTATAAADATASEVVAIPAQAATLTTAQDAKTLGAGDDTISGSLVANGATGSTAQPGDTVKGGLGADKLSLSVSGDSGGAYTLQALITDSIETVHVSNFETDAAGGGARNTVTTIDATLMTGLTEVGLSASAAEGDTKFDNVLNIVDVAMQNGAGDLQVAYVAGVTTGTQSQNIALSNVSAGTLAIAGVENLNITSGLVKSTLTALTDANMKSITVTGSTDLKITNALDFAADLTGVTGATDGTIDASDFTGKLNVTVTADEHSITGGSGNDTFNMAGTLNGYDKVVGGDGLDTLTMDAATITTQFTGVSGIETVAFNDTSTAYSIASNKLNGDVSQILLSVKDDTIDGNETAFAVTGYDESETVWINRQDFDLDLDDAPSVTITSTTDTAEDTVNVKLYGIGLNGDDGAGVASDEFGIGTLDVSNYETVNIDSSKTTGLTANELIAVTASSATSVNLTGAAALTIGSLTLNAKATSVDASAMTGALTAAIGANNATYKMPSVSSTLTFGANLNNKDTVIGGAGKADSVTATASGLTALTSAVTLTDVESLMLTTSGNNTLALADVTGLKTLGVTANTQTITGFDLASTIEASGAAAVVVTAADATGTDDTLKFRQKLNGSVDNTVVALSGIENLSIEVRDTAATVNVAGFNLTNFRGDQVTYSQSPFSATAVTVDSVGTTLYKTVDTINATGLKGAFTAAATNATDAVTFNVQGAGIQTIAGGAKADTFNIGITAGAVAHVVTGNAGKDVTNLTVGAALADVGTIDTETVNMTVPAAVSANLTTSFGTGVDYVTVTGGNSLSTIALGAIVTEIKSVDASGLLGRMTATIANDALDSTVEIKGASALTDAVTTSFATAATTYSMKSSGVEALVIAATPAATTTVNTATAVGLGSIVVSQGNTATQTFTVAGLSGIETITLQDSDDATAGTNEHILAASLADATGDADVIKFKVGSGTIDDGARLQTADIETVSINANAAADLDLTNLTMTAAGKVMSLTVTGDSALTISGLGSDVTTIDASGMSLGGSVVQTARATTGTVEYTGSAGADTFILSNFGDTVVGGAGSDTLDINYAAILGGINVNLAASQQIVSANGSATAGSASGFENVDLSGYTGSFGALITSGSSATASTTAKIVGSPQADQIVLASGADTVVLSSTLTTSDQIGGFTLSNDAIDIDAAASGTGITVGGLTSNVNLNGAGGAALAISKGMTTVEDNVSALTPAGIFAALTSGANDLTLANADNVVYLAIDNGVDTAIARIDSGAGNVVIAADEITVIGIITGVADATTLVAANFTDFA